MPLELHGLMPTAALRPCSKAGCGALVRTGSRCAQHAKPIFMHHTSRQARGYGREHEALRRIVLAEEPACRTCGETEALTLDHIIPLSQGGQTIRANAQTLCRRCQHRKASQEGRAAR